MDLISKKQQHLNELKYIPKYVHIALCNVGLNWEHNTQEACLKELDKVIDSCYKMKRAIFFLKNVDSPAPKLTKL